MANNLIYWPNKILVPRVLGLTKLAANVKGNPSLSGVTQVSSSSAGIWKIVAKGFPLTSKDRIKIWRAIEGQANGMLGQIVFTLREADRVPVSGKSDPVPHSDNSTFSDGSQYASQVYSVKSASAVARGATSISIDHGTQVAPEPGQPFSADVRLYSITKIISSANGVTQVSFWPPARDEIFANQPLMFDRPQILCRLASDDEMAAEDLDMARFTYGEVTFIEDVGPILT